MNVFLAVALGSVIALGVLSLTNSASRVDHKVEHQEAVVQLDQYRLFMFVADQYMRSAPPVTSVTAIRWSTLRASTGAPPAARATGMPNSWRVVQTPSAGWVACTEMEERSIAALGRLAPKPSGPAVAGTTAAALTPIYLAGGGSASHLVVGAPENAAALAALCR